MHHHIDALAYTNRLRCLPPGHKLLFTGVLLGLSYLTPLSLQVLIVAWLARWIISYAGIPAPVYWRLQAVPLGFWLMSLPALILGWARSPQLAAIHTDIWQGIWVGPVYFYVSQQGTLQAGQGFGRLMAMTACLYFLLLTTPLVEIVRVLRRLGCPVLVTELLALMYRFIFLLTDTVAELLTAQTARLGYRTWRSRLHSLGLVVGQLLQRTLTHYRQTALGLAARGFTGEIRVWYPHRYQPSRRYAWEAIGGCGLLLLLTGWQHAYGT
ncbi:cobalt ECF transporter T component CbiQ [Trichothermofontia sp.]